jgi:hypothetical protein
MNCRAWEIGGWLGKITKLSEFENSEPLYNFIDSMLALDILPILWSRAANHAGSEIIIFTAAPVTAIVHRI